MLEDAWLDRQSNDLSDEFFAKKTKWKWMDLNLDNNYRELIPPSGDDKYGAACTFWVYGVIGQLRTVDAQGVSMSPN